MHIVIVSHQLANHPQVIPSTLHHQQDLDLVLALSMCRDSCEEKGQQLVKKICRLQKYILFFPPIVDSTSGTRWWATA